MQISSELKGRITTIAAASLRAKLAATGDLQGDCLKGAARVSRPGSSQIILDEILPKLLRLEAPLDINVGSFNERLESRVIDVPFGPQFDMPHELASPFQ